ncbi:glycosyltransferase family 2 protein [Frigidibacter oleivorans]|uniref:glycosyltransferase family 2 protein n=1 Tax=Frigidibacter oleivorans TaxID=2487129 RepID=UPI0013E070BA|nr:glycosyltransferase family 2 protein [Frigidibacter oleivorans]
MMRQDGQGGDWIVVATVDEPAPLLAAFAAHHLAMGARQVQLFLDRPDAGAQALLSGLPGVRVTLCDPAYWARHPRGQRPPRHTARQKANAALVQAGTDAAWILHCDADEFLSAPPRPALDAAEADTDWLTLPVAERAFRPLPQEGLFDGLFRRPLEDWAEAGPLIHGGEAGYLNRGLTGHTAGKGLFRTGRGIEIGIHAPVPAAGRAWTGAAARDLRLLHFDGLTPLHLALKLLKRATETYGGPPRPHGAHRIAQFTEMARLAPDRRGWREFLRRLQTVTEAQEAALAARHGLFAPDPPADIAQVAGQALPGLDLSPDTFDAALQAREAELIAATGLAV